MTASHRIGQIGNFKKPWCTEVHLSAALASNGHTVVPYQEDEVEWPLLARRAREDGVDLVMWTRTWPTPLDAGRRALDELRGFGIPSVAYHLDRWWGLNREHQVRDEPMFSCNVVCTADGGHDDRWAEAGVRHWWFPPAVLGAEAALPGRFDPEFDHDVAFVGSWEQYHAEWYYRMELVGKLRSWYASGTQQHLGLWPHRNQPIRGQRLNDLYTTAKVIVGDSCLAGNARAYWSDRIPETLGRGGFLIHSRVDGLAEHYTDDEHLVCYDLGDWPTLRNLIDLYRREPEERARIATAGRQHVLTHHTYERRMQDLIDRLHTEGILAAPDAAVGRRRYWDRHGTSAVFELRAGTDDALVVNEVWREDTYGLTPDMIMGRPVIDCGANVGAFTVWASLAGASEVVAVEPVRANMAALCDNVTANGLDGRVQFLEMAVGGAFGPRSIVDRGACSHVVRGAKGGEPVHTTTLDALLAGRGSAVVKLDVEGAEYETIGGFTRWDAVDRIVMEFHGPGLNPEAWAALHGDIEDLFGEMVATLAERGRVTIFGRPSTGGTLTWEAYR